MHAAGKLFILSGPSGCGKTTLAAAWLKQSSNLRLTTSCTTRSIRPGELDGQDYHFLSNTGFQQHITAGDFLEHALVHGNHYGTRQNDVANLLLQGRDVLLEIDWQGANQVAAQMTNVKRIFILPPSLATLRKRLTSRGQDSDTVIEQRVAAAKAEIAHAGEAHIQIINDDFDHALQELLHYCKA
ncbi:MAG: guanylate kinase [Mariprofundaceae bacterium]